MVKKIKQIYYQSIEETETLIEEVILEDLLGTYNITIYNDDVNTFEWVIKCLEKYCDHNHEQAEQCTWFIHFKGKYAVKMGGREQLKPICEALKENGLNAKLEES